MENLDNALATLINTALAGIDTSIGFLQAELPDVIVQLLMWHGVKSGVFFVSGLALLLIPLISLRIIKKGYRPYEPAKKAEELVVGEHVSRFRKVDTITDYSTIPNSVYYTETIEGAIVPVLCGASSIVGFAGGLTLINITWLQIWIAPKVWLLEYAARLVN